MIKKGKGDNHDKVKEKSMGEPIVVKEEKGRRMVANNKGHTWTSKEEGEKKKEENRGQEGNEVSFEP
jgi:hypothetical protein